MLSSFDELEKSNVLSPLVMEKFKPISGISNHTVFDYIHDFNFRPIADHAIVGVINRAKLRVCLTGIARACLPLRQCELYNSYVCALVIGHAHLTVFDSEPRMTVFRTDGKE